MKQYTEAIQLCLEEMKAVLNHKTNMKVLLCDEINSYERYVIVHDGKSFYSGSFDRRADDTTIYLFWMDDNEAQRIIKPYE